MNPDDLIRIAEHLASGGLGGGIGRPVQAELRRAVSAAYYALFHALSRSCANILVGVAPASRSQPAWSQVYRALEHGYAKNQCAHWNKLSRFPRADTGFRASYSSPCSVIVKKPTTIPNAQFFRSDVLRFIDEAKRAISEFARYRRQRPTGIRGLCTVQSQTKLTHP